TVNEGDTAHNSGTFSDIDLSDVVSISASIGNITQDSGHAGSWSWSFGTDDGPSQSQTVTITSTDRAGAQAGITFALTVLDVAPSNVYASFSSPVINAGETETLSGSFTDPGTLDTHAVAIHWADGSADTTLNLAAGLLTFSTTHQYINDPSGPVTVTVIDK